VSTTDQTKLLSEKHHAGKDESEIFTYTLVFLVAQAIISFIAMRNKPPVSGGKYKESRHQFDESTVDDILDITHCC
jgi:hypothetical protein